MNIEALMRALLYIASMALVGMPIGLWSVGRSALPAPLFQAVQVEGVRLLRVAAVASAVAAAGLLFAQSGVLAVADASGDALRRTLTRDVLAQTAVVRAALSVTLLLVLLIARAPRLQMALATVAGVLLHMTIVRTSHTVAMEGAWRDLLVSYAHLLGGALWAGGLLVLVLCTDAIADSTDAAAPSSADTSEVTARLIERFSPFGMMAVALVAGTGMLVTATHVQSLDVLLAPGYGRILLFKLCAVALAVLFAGYHKRAVAKSMRTDSDLQRFRRTLWIELLIVLFVFYLAALLASQSMPSAGHEHNAAALPTLAGYTLPVWVEFGVLAIALISIFAAAVELRARARRI